MISVFSKAPPCLGTGGESSLRAWGTVPEIIAQATQARKLHLAAKLKAIPRPNESGGFMTFVYPHRELRKRSV